MKRAFDVLMPDDIELNNCSVIITDHPAVKRALSAKCKTAEAQDHDCMIALAPTDFARAIFNAL